MSNITVQNAIENALIKGDLAGLTSDQRLSYYKSVCESVGLNALTKPFEYIQLNGKLTLYATRACTDQLRSVHKVSIKITAREKFDDIYIVTAQATNSEGRFDESTGAVNVNGLKGEALANAYLKAETKAKRRVTLSLCGLGLLDETEVETISDAKPFVEVKPTQERPVNVTAALDGHKIEKNTRGPVIQLDEIKNTIKGDHKEHIVYVKEENLGEFVCNIGKKYKGLKLNEMKDFEIASFSKWLVAQAKEQNKTITGPTLEFIEKADLYLKSIQQNDPKFNEREEIPF